MLLEISSPRQSNVEVCVIRKNKRSPFGFNIALHRRIFFFVFQHAFVHYSFLLFRFPQLPKPVLSLVCVSFSLSLFFFSRFCCCFVYECSSDHPENNNNNINRMICTCSTLFAPPVFFLCLSTSFISLLYLFFSLFSAHTHYKKKKMSPAKNNERISDRFFYHLHFIFTNGRDIYRNNVIMRNKRTKWCQ